MSIFLLKIGDGQNPQNFTDVAGVRAASINSSAPMVENSGPATGEFRNIETGAGVKSLDITGSGIVLSNTNFTELLAAHRAGLAKNYQLHFENDEVVECAFFISQINRDVSSRDEEKFTITLNSTGAINYA